MITIFYIFSFLQVLTSSFLLLANNPVHSILFLILLLVESLMTFCIFNFEFISLLFILVYVGAIAVLFLFVIMVLRVKLDEFDALFFLPLNFAINLYLILYLFSTMQSSLFLAFSLDVSNVLCFNAIKEMFNIGEVFYNFAILLVIMGPLVLFLLALLKNGRLSDFFKLSFLFGLVISSQAKGFSLSEGNDAIETAASLAEVVVPSVDASASYEKKRLAIFLFVGTAATFMFWYYLLPAVAAHTAVVVTKAEKLPQSISTPTLPVTEVGENIPFDGGKLVWLGDRWASAWKDAPIPEVSLSLPEPKPSGLGHTNFKVLSWFGKPKKVIDTTAIPDPFAEMKECHWLVHPKNPDNVVKVTEAIVKIVTETPPPGIS